MFFLPLFSDFLLVDHDLVCFLLVAFVAFLLFKKTVLQMGNLDIALVIQFIDTSLEHNLEAVDLRKCTLFLISELIYEFAKPFIVIEVAFIVTHV